MLIIKQIDIKGVGPIQDLSLSLNPHMNIICGTNGIGKTTILDCIAQSFSYDKFTLRKNALSEAGGWTLHYFDKKDAEKTLNKSLKEKYLSAKERGNNGDFEKSLEVIVFKVNRLLPYKDVPNITKDPTKSQFEYASNTATGADYNTIKDWLLHRYLWSAHENALDEIQKNNLSKALECFNFVNPEYSFSRVVPTTNDIMLSTAQGEIELEQLSSGYISMIVVLLGIIKEIEYRFKEPRISVTDFSGVVIIDEMDVHLHPEMQARMYYALDQLLPKAQIISSTHSPHILQVAKPDEIIPLVKDGDLIRVNPLANREFGCQGWSVEEILEDLMGMSTTKSGIYRDTIKAFSDAIEREDGRCADESFDLLSKMLHPNSVLRQVLEIQKLGLRDD